MGLTYQVAAEVPVNFSIQAWFDGPEPKVEFEGRSFCLTGKPADKIPRKDLEGKDKEIGGKVYTRVMVDLDYLVICVRKK